MLPADTVRKVGVRRLQDLVDMTHTPVKTKGPNHLANGGFPKFDTDAFVQSMEQQRAASTQASMAAGEAAMNQAQADADAAAKRAPTAVPSPATAAPVAAPSPAATPSTSQSLDQRVAQIPTGGQTAPAADGSQSSWSNTESGRNLSNIATALPGAMGGAIPAIAKTGGAISGGIDAATRLLNAGAGAAAISAIPGAASAQSPAFPPSPAGAGRGMVNPASVDPASPPPASPPSTTAPSASPATTSNVTRVGNSYSGSNVSGDITINGQAPRNGGTISPQNMAAADNLASAQVQDARARLMAAGTGQAPGVQAPPVLHSGNDWQSRNDLRNAQVSASSITQSDKWGKGGDRTATAAYQALLGADNAARVAQPGVGVTTMRENAGLQREGMQQAGDTERTGIRAEGVNAANQISSGRLKLEQIAAGYSNRSADRLDRAQAAVETATTPEARKSARERLMALAGTAPQNEWKMQVTPTTKNADGSTTQGSAFRYNTATGEVGRVDAGQPADIGKDPRAVAIRDNAKLSPQQKWAELQRLGYL